MKIIISICENVLISLYQTCGFSVVLSVVSMYFYLYAAEKSMSGQGYKQAVLIWFKQFRSSLKFRRLFFLVFYTSMILFRTLLNRDLWLNPLSDVLGDWWIYKTDLSTGEIILTVNVN